MKAYALTDVGITRTVNQDYVFYTEDAIGNLPNLLVLADGMGGHRAGDTASRCAVETLTEYVRNADGADPITILDQGIVKANEAVFNKASESEEFYGMGTTLVVACIMDSIMYVANVGDSRLYIMDRELRQVTRDHSYVEEMVSIGAIDRDAARNHKRKNEITRAIGGESSVLPDFFPIDLQKGSKVLMCSDGLTNMVEDYVIEKILKTSDDLGKAARKLVDLANENGGKDNISVILAQI